MEIQEQYDYLFKIVLIGDTGVGKSNILSRYVSNKFKVDTATTIGVEFTTKNMTINYNGHQTKVKLQLWDTAGQERYRSITSAYYRGAVGALLVYDITRPTSFEKCADWMHELKQHAGTEVQVVLVGNKSDLRHLREVQEDEGKNLAQKEGVTFIETSAQNGANVEESFELLVRCIIDLKNKQGNQADQPGFKPDVVDVIDKDDKKKVPSKGCC
ncbi:Rab11 [Hexamita inflata]|uniref:Rab11 n=1 Tax=Hexamita inflata TaxID=28002 RepID=A0AA86P593_9EUKA|nr:Rab11 [Hexamita inflata]CAI9931273.1 Rab11 [Hexamita inflata]CAI9938803.1 Rab11 [Hexamita inflata]CAI9964771.1 Rab11 [Hexamita inflata]CAI9971623.1 Rab11 [Hexamita inflata]